MSQKMPNMKEDMVMCHQQMNKRLGPREMVSSASSNTGNYGWRVLKRLPGVLGRGIMEVVGDAPYITDCATGEKED